MGTAKILKIFERLSQNGVPYCKLCLRNANERRMVSPVSVRAIISAINVEIDERGDDLTVCYICEAKASSAHRFINLVHFAIAANMLFSEMINEDHKKNIEEFLLGMNGEKKSHLSDLYTAAADCEMLLDKILRETSLKQTEMLVIDSEQRLTLQQLFGRKKKANTVLDMETVVVIDDDDNDGDPLEIKCIDVDKECNEIQTENPVQTAVGNVLKERNEKNEKRPAMIVISEQNEQNEKTSSVTVMPQRNERKEKKPAATIIPERNKRSEKRPAATVITERNEKKPAATVMTERNEKKEKRSAATVIPEQNERNEKRPTVAVIAEQDDRNEKRPAITVIPEANASRLTNTITAPSMQLVPNNHILLVSNNPMLQNMNSSNLVILNDNASNMVQTNQNINGFCNNPVILNHSNQMNRAEISESFTYRLMTNEAQNLLTMDTNTSGFKERGLTTADQTNKDDTLDFNIQQILKQKINQLYHNNKESDYVPDKKKVKSTLEVSEVKSSEVVKQPVQKDGMIDFEDKIPMDVISFMDATDPNGPTLMSSFAKKRQYAPAKNAKPPHSQSPLIQPSQSPLRVTFKEFIP